MDRRRSQRPAGGAEAYGWLIAAAVVIVAVGGAWATLWLGHEVIDSTGVTVARNPFDALAAVATGELQWPPSAVPILAGLGAAALVVFVGVVVVVRRQARAAAQRRASRHMAHRQELKPYLTSGVVKKAKRFGVPNPKKIPGLLMGVTVEGAHKVWSSWEDMVLVIAGPRTRKTVSQAIPHVVSAPGAVIMTSNKRDLVDATRDVRAEHGHVWVFDPQDQCGEPASWWWDPLSYVTSEVRAAQLAEHFASGSQAGDARKDAFFDSAAQDLLAGLLLAAACRGDPITQVWSWLTSPTDLTPVEVLTDAGYELTADAVAAIISSPEKQRGGVFGTAMQMASSLTNSAVLPWITKQGEDDTRPRFVAETFVRSTDTLAALSREGKGTAGPLVTALTVAVCEAGEEYAATRAKGRMPIPLVGVLDEAANVCRWRELPNLYSHFGSRGLILVTILQTWAQGVEVWGERGMDKLWSAANVRLYAGGVGEAPWLDKLSQLIGDYDRPTGSVSSRAGADRQVSRQVSRERVMDVADLTALPVGKAVMFASGVPATMLNLVDWWDGPHADEIAASVAVHDPDHDADEVAV